MGMKSACATCRFVPAWNGDAATCGRGYYVQPRTYGGSCWVEGTNAEKTDDCAIMSDQLDVIRKEKRERKKC